MDEKEVCKEIRNKKRKKKCKCFKSSFFSFFFAKISKNNDFFSSVQRLHYHWKVLACRVGKYTVENDFVNHDARNENKSAIKIYASFSFHVFFFFLQTVQTVLHITTKNQGYSLKKTGLIQVLGE